MEKERVNYYTRKLWNANHTTEIRNILKEFEFECAGQPASTSDEALPIGSVGGNEVELCDYCDKRLYTSLICDECLKDPNVHSA